MGKFKTGKGLPCGFALLPGKSVEVYTIMVDALLRKVDADGNIHR
jgi:hypothetical protein